MQTIQDRLILQLRAYRTIGFCAPCLALKMGALCREVQEALSVICSHEGFEVTPGKCSECLQEQMVVRALAADSHS